MLQRPGALAKSDWAVSLRVSPSLSTDMPGLRAAKSLPARGEAQGASVPELRTSFQDIGVFCLPHQLVAC